MYKTEAFVNNGISLVGLKLDYREKKHLYMRIGELLLFASHYRSCGTAWEPQRSRHGPP
jgi:hypothetical protein